MVEKKMEILEDTWKRHQIGYSDVVCLCACDDCRIVGKNKGLIYVNGYGWCSPDEIKNNKRLSDALLHYKDCRSAYPAGKNG